jgi:RNA polymerase sigma factor (sigma-70 family)
LGWTTHLGESLNAQLAQFEEVLLPHIDAAFNLARHLTRDDHDAEDVVQDSYLRALKYFASYHGTNGRAWLLRIVRHTFYTRRKRQRRGDDLLTEFDDEIHSSAAAPDDPERLLLRRDAGQVLREALAKLPAGAREVIVLRELEGLSYREISQVTGLPIGTVMSRLSRARERLQLALKQHQPEEG